jgi:hypothetical protein
MPKRHYSRAFKLKVVQAVESGEFLPAQACSTQGTGSARA